MKCSSIAEYLKIRLQGRRLKPLADFLNTTEVSISRARSGKQNLSTHKIFRLAEYFRDDPGQLLRIAGYDAEADALDEAANKNLWLKPAPGIASNIVPVVGRVSAGEVDLQYEYTDQGFPVGAADEALNLAEAGENDYGLLINGDSMSPAIPSGSRIIVQPTKPFANGKLHVIRAADGRCWVKIALLHGDTYTLKSINPDYPTIYLHADQVRWVHSVRWIKLP